MKGSIRFWSLFILIAVLTAGCSSGGGSTTGDGPAITADIEAPSAPTGLTATAAGSSVIDLVWSASTDNVSVAGYRVFRNEVEIGTSVSTAYTDLGLTPNTAYSYTVAAYDAANNVSAKSEPASATTLATGGTDSTGSGAVTVKLPQTGQTTGYGAGDDGTLQNGASWPSPRFSQSDGTIVDRLTGLAWAPDGNLAPAQDWQHALDYVANLNQENYLGHSDWRLPNRRELRSLINYGVANTASWLVSEGVVTAQAGEYWTSTYYSKDPKDAWSVNMQGGQVVNDSKTKARSVWPVRAGDGRYSATVTSSGTGQTACYDASGASVGCAGTGQDGALQKGTPWPAPRFSENGDGTLTDRLTRLAWSKDARSPGPGACSQGTTKTQKTWRQALDYATCLNDNNYLGHSDWRLPNINELESLVHAGQPDSAGWLVSQGFSNVQAQSYWTATTFNSSDAYSDSAWFIDMRDGYVARDYQTSSYYAWPVRGGE